MDAVQRGGLSGLVLEQTRRLGRSLPGFVSDRLTAVASRTGAEQMHVRHALAGIVGAFNRGNVPVMLLKGAALNLTVYRRADLRPMSDVDLLVHPRAAGRAVRLLEEYGCQRGFELIRDDFFPRYHYEVELILPFPKPVRIDLHARPLRPMRISRYMPDDALWEGAESVRIGDATTWVPRPELMFLHLAAHAAYHGCSRLLWLYDLVRLVETFGATMDWALVVRCAHGWRLSLSVRRAIEQATKLLGPVCPVEVLTELSVHPVTWRDRLTLDQAPRDAASPAIHVLCNLLCTPGVRFRLGYVRAMLLPGRAHLAGLYKLRHPGWIACAHLWRSIRAVVRLATLPFTRFAQLAGR